MNGWAEERLTRDVLFPLLCYGSLNSHDAFFIESESAHPDVMGL